MSLHKLQYTYNHIIIDCIYSIHLLNINICIKYLLHRNQGIIDLTGTKTRQIFSRMSVTARKIKELFTLT